MRMQSISDFEESAAYLTSSCSVSYTSQWNSTQSPISKSLNLNLDSPMKHSDHAKHLGLHLQNQQSPPSPSTDQSHLEVASIGADAVNAEPGYDGTLLRPVNGNMKQVLTLGKPDYVFPSSTIEYAQPVACIAFTHADPYTGGIPTAYGPQAFIHPQMLGIQSARVPLPPDLAEDEPIYVNAKQYHGILRRRQSRAKLEAQNKLVKARKPYLHESRHLHAMKRARGAGGRFLNTKNLQQSELNPAAEGNGMPSGTSLLQLGGNGDISKSKVNQSENGNAGAPTMFSEVTNVSNGGSASHKTNMGFSGFHSHVGGNLQQGGSLAHGGAHYRVSVTH